MQEKLILYSAIEVLRYSDYFEYPLKLKEIHQFLSIKANIKSLELVLNENKRRVSNLDVIDGMWVINNHQDIISNRIRRNEISSKIWVNLKTILPLITNIPFIEMVAITGSLAVDNSEINSDVDLLVITQPNRVWITRLLLFFIEKFVQRRHNIKLCFNYILSSNNVKQKTESIFVAREIVQMVPVYGISSFKHFIYQNIWITQYFPNLDIHQHITLSISSPKMISRKSTSLIINSLTNKNNINSRILDVLDRLEYKRAVSNIIKRYELGIETKFSIKEYKGHFNGHQHSLIQKLQNNSLDE